MECCMCFKWVNLRSSLLSSKFNALGSSHSWSSPICRVSACSGSLTIQYRYHFSFGASQHSYLHCLICSFWPLCQCSAPHHSRLQTFYPSSTHCNYPPSYVSGCFSTPPAPSSSHDLLRVSSMEGLRARSAERLHFISLHPVNVICIQKSLNLNSFSSFCIPGYSSLRPDRTHSRSGILSPNDPHPSSGIIVFVRQGLFEFSSLLFA